MSQLISMWPLFGLHIRAGSLELRIPNADQLADLACLAAEGIHSPEEMPFSVPWTDASPADRALSTIRYHYGKWASWSPSDWYLPFVVLDCGVVVGTQEIFACEFATRREVSTGSWLGERFQARGIGTRMRAAVLEFAFGPLGAQVARSAAMVDNVASLAVSRKLGYVADGTDTLAPRGMPVVSQRLRLDRDAWLARERVDIEVSGLGPCLPQFGVG